MIVRSQARFFSPGLGLYLGINYSGDPQKYSVNLDRIEISLGYFKTQTPDPTPSCPGLHFAIILMHFVRYKQGWLLNLWGTMENVNQ